MSSAFKGQLLPEIWVIVLSHLRQPIAAPLSQPARTDLSQPHLVIACRVSKEWHSICERLLYEHVVTSNFPELAQYACLSSNHRRFKLTKSLRIEYWAKGHLTYSALLKSLPRNGAALWECVGMKNGQAEDVAVNQCGQEVADLTEALTMLVKRRMRTTFPKLETVAVGSLYGRDDDVWDRYEKSWPDASASIPIQKCTTLFSDWLASGNLRHLCTRDSSGPLCIEFTTHAHGGGPGGYPVDYTRTLHFNKDADQLALPLGGKIRWVSDAPPTEDMSSLLLAIGRCAGHLYRSRQAMNGELRASGRFFAADKADVDIYCSTSQYGPEMFGSQLITYGLNPLPSKSGGRFTSRAITEREQRDMTATLQGKIQNLFRSTSGVKDEFRWHLSQETPYCLACGSGVPT